MKGVIDMDEINFCVIIKGVDWLVGWMMEKMASNTVANNFKRITMGRLV